MTRRRLITEQATLPASDYRAPAFHRSFRLKYPKKPSTALQSLTKPPPFTSASSLANLVRPRLIKAAAVKWEIGANARWVLSTNLNRNDRPWNWDRNSIHEQEQVHTVQSLMGTEWSRIAI